MVLSGLSRVYLVLDGNIVGIIRDAFVHMSQTHVGIARAAVMKNTCAELLLITCNKRCYMVLLAINIGCCRCCTFVLLHDCRTCVIGDSTRLNPKAK